MLLTGKDKRYLRSIGNGLKPTVMIGQEGLTDAILRSIDQAHQNRELIKLKMLELDRHERKVVAEAIEQTSESVVVGTIGGVILLYRRNEEDPEIDLPSLS